MQRAARTGAARTGAARTGAARTGAARDGSGKGRARRGLRSRSLDRRGRCRTGQSVAKSRVPGAGMVYLRRPACLPHAPISLGPGRKGRVVLFPMGHGGLVTPVHQVRHRCFVGAGEHVCAHTFVAIPSCHRPEGPVTIGQQRTHDKSRSPLHLPTGTEGMDPERRNEAKRPDSEACKTYKNHLCFLMQPG